MKKSETEMVLGMLALLASKAYQDSWVHVVFLICAGLSLVLSIAYRFWGDR